MINLYDFLEGCNGQLFGEPVGRLFTDLSFDARQPQDTHLYVALSSNDGDIQAAMREAARNGAAGILSATPPTFNSDHLSVILVRDVQAALLGWTRYTLQRLAVPVVLVIGTAPTAPPAQAVRQVLSSLYHVHFEVGHEGWLALPRALARLMGEREIIVLESDARQINGLSELLRAAQPAAVVVTGFDAAAGPEMRGLIEALPAQTFVALNYDDDIARAVKAATAAQVSMVGVGQFGADFLAYRILAHVNGTGFDLWVNDSRFVGRWINTLGLPGLRAALYGLAVGVRFGIPVEAGLRRLQELEPLPGYMRPLPGADGCTLIDDTADADGDGVLAALDWLAAIRPERRRAFVVLGDLDRAVDEPQPVYQALGRAVASTADFLATVGVEAAGAAHAAVGAGMERERVYTTFDALEAAGHLLRDNPPGPGDVVLIAGGATARMEQVTAALLARQVDKTLLVRRPGPTVVRVNDESIRPSRVEIDLDALAGNVRLLKALVGPTVTLAAVVKADAYGSGAVAVARTAALNGADYLAVASLDEALELREARIREPILVMSYVPPSAVRLAVRHQITVTVYDAGLAAACDRAAGEAGGRLRVHVKVDTGMGRLGVMPADTMALFRLLADLRNLDIEGFYTHFAAADEDAEFTAEQAQTFVSLLAPLQAAGFRFRYVHAANSAATLAFPQFRYNLVRVGLAMHGLSPSAIVPLPEGFRPVLRWKTLVAQVKTLPSGHSVGYGRTYRCEEDQRIAVLPVGYAAGFRRGPANWGQVLVRGQFAPLVGRVSMEKSAIDVTHIPDVAIGDEVVLIGEQGDQRITADDVARQLGTISYEVLCSVLARTPRR